MAGRYKLRGAEDESALVKLNPGEGVLAEEIKVISSQTRPPARFNEATLLSAMESAGKLVEDEDLREAMSAKGLGTPATRASIIEGLVAENYLQREGRELRSYCQGIFADHLIARPEGA